MKHAFHRSTAVSHARILGFEIVAVTTASSVAEELAPAMVLVEVKSRNIARADSFVFHLRTSV